MNISGVHLTQARSLFEFLNLVASMEGWTSHRLFYSGVPEAEIANLGRQGPFYHVQMMLKRSREKADRSHIANGKDTSLSTRYVNGKHLQHVPDE